jgi:hypothetical protein
MCKHHKLIRFSVGYNVKVQYHLKQIEPNISQKTHIINMLLRLSNSAGRGSSR